MDTQWDLLVLGAGPAGEGAAMMAAKHGLKVAVIERHTEVGGGCTHWGTIPSKALRHAVKTVADAAANPLLKELRTSIRLDYPRLLTSATRVIEQQVGIRRRFYERNRVPLIQGSGRLIDANTVAVKDGNGPEQTYATRHVVVATGSRPYRPPELDFSHHRVRDSDTILQLDETPLSLVIYGAGVIGCEYASIFVKLGCKVTLINAQDRLLSFMDDEIAEALSYHLREQGVIVRNNEQFKGLDFADDGIVLNLKSGRRVKGDFLLWANGRTGNTDKLQLHNVGLSPNSRGQLPVNAHYQTPVPNIYAVGDVSGPPALASAAYDQGRFAVEHLLGRATDVDRFRLLPSGIYTIPEISSVGQTEQELRAAGVPYEMGHAHFKSLARAQMTGETTGMLKILFHAESLKVLGVHCFGDNASEIVHIGQMVMASDHLNSLRSFVDTTFNYPTMAEAYRVAAFNGLNRLA